MIENGDGYGYQDGYDGAGGIGNYTDQPLSEYDIIFSDSNRLGEQGRGLGTLPAQVTIRRATEAPESTNNNSKFFNPRAKVIFQDSTEEPYDPEMSQMNKQFFSFENAETAKGGAYLFTTGLEGNSPTGSFIRAYFNPREQKMTYYYRCSATNRWIISKEPYVPAVQNTLDLGSGMIFGTNNKVFQWIPFFSRPVF